MGRTEIAGFHPLSYKTLQAMARKTALFQNKINGMGIVQSKLMTAGQISDYTGAAALLGSLPAAEWMIADRGYDADWFRDALKDKGIRPCIPGRKSRGKAVRYDKRRYRRRNRIEIMFGRMKDWHRVATRYDRSAKTFLSAVALAATVMFCL